MGEDSAMTKEYLKEFQESLPKTPEPHDPPPFFTWSMFLMLPLVVLYFGLYFGLALCIAAVLVFALPYFLVTWAYSIGGVIAAVFVGWLYVSVFLAIVDA